MIELAASLVMEKIRFGNRPKTTMPRSNGILGNTASTLWTFRTFMVVAAIGTVLAAGYLLWMYQRVGMGTPKPEFEDAHIHDVGPAEWIAWTPLILLTVALGVYPQLIFGVTDRAVTRIFGG
ncbi:MAG: hypothetical protein ACKORK_11140 [Gemmatimonadota bacterium]